MPRLLPALLLLAACAEQDHDAETIERHDADCTYVRTSVDERSGDALGVEEGAYTATGLPDWTLVTADETATRIAYRYDGAERYVGREVAYRIDGTWEPSTEEIVAYDVGLGIASHVRSVYHSGFSTGEEGVYYGPGEEELSRGTPPRWPEAVPLAGLPEGWRGYHYDFLDRKRRPAGDWMEVEVDARDRVRAVRRGPEGSEATYAETIRYDGDDYDGYVVEEVSPSGAVGRMELVVTREPGRVIGVTTRDGVPWARTEALLDDEGRRTAFRLWSGDDPRPQTVEITRYVERGALDGLGPYADLRELVPEPWGLSTTRLELRHASGLILVSGYVEETPEGHVRYQSATLLQRRMRGARWSLVDEVRTWVWPRPEAEGVGELSTLTRATYDWDCP